VSSQHERDKDQKLVKNERNLARYFTETRHVAWVLLVATVAWGIFAYVRMPKAKDPLVPVRVAVATCQWPGARAEKLEELVTRKIEQKIAENSKVEKIESISRGSVSIVYVTLKEEVSDRGKELDDIKGKLDSIHDLPQGAGPVNFIKDFGDTAALLLTVASPKVGDVELSLRARAVARAITEVRRSATLPGARATMIVSFPPSINSMALRRVTETGVRTLVDGSIGSDPRIIEGPGFLGIDLVTTLDDKALVSALVSFARERLRLSELHPDVWFPTVVRDPKDAEARLRAVVGDRYSYRQLDEYTDTIQRYLQTVSQVSKVTRSGVLPEQIYLEYSQERLAAYNVQPSGLGDLLSARNITVPGGQLEIGQKNITIDPSGELHSEQEIGDVSVGTSSGGAPQYLRDLVEVSRDYQSPARYLNFLTARGPDGKMQRTRAITLAVQMRPGEQIADFGVAVDKRLSDVQKLLPEDLILRRTSDQPLQVRENVSLFMNSLYEAIALVVVVGLIGFWEWRSALILALSIPITLAMTFGFMLGLGIDIQQISIASLILALGLLVDDPVVAGDAIKRSLADGWKPLIAAWLGPTKLATAILFATITNIVAYLPLLVMGGDVGKFIYSLPVVLTASLVASRIVSMTFIPMLGYYLLRPSKKPELSAEEKRQRGFARYYYRTVGWAIDHRLKVAGIALLLLLVGVAGARSLKTAFFPQDLSYLSYVDVWLPEDAPLSATREKAREAEAVIREVTEEFGKTHPGKDGKPREVLESLTTFVGGGGPRFWFSVSPEMQQLNYAQIIVQAKEKHDTPHLVVEIQRALSTKIAGARLDARQLENGKPVGIPIQVRIAGDNLEQLRALAEKVKTAFRAIPTADRVRDDWGAETFTVKLEVDPDRANLAGVTNLDVASSSVTAMNGRVLGTLREGDRQIPMIARLRGDERAQLDQIQSLYVTSLRGSQKVPLRSVSRVAYGIETEKIRRRNQFRTITVAAFPTAGVLPSEVVKLAEPAIAKIAAEAPPGYEVTIGGEKEEQKKGFAQLALVLGLSIFCIFLALVIQFKNAVKPVVVFAAIPFGVVGALVSLAVMHAPFGFMAFLGIISLIGVIVSHIIVLFDFIEEAHEKGEPLRDALLEAGIARLRPVLITVGATVLGLVPLAMHGGPLWEPLCYAQIGGLTVATFLTLLLVPVIYSIMVNDLGWITWEHAPAKKAETPFIVKAVPQI
jgi:multidrug efflux pump subunit AcrB